MEFKTSVYDSFMYPFEKLRLKKERKLLISRATGNVLEIGPGTGANLPFYNKNSIEHFTFIEPEFDINFLEKLDTIDNKNIIETTVESIPFSDNTFDTIVFALVFCSVIDAKKGLKEILRVLKPDGQILFIEHIEPSNIPLKFAFNFINPIWSNIAKGCNLNRNTVELIEKVGFNIENKKFFFTTSFVSGIGKIK